MIEFIIAFIFVQSAPCVCVCVCAVWMLLHLHVASVIKSMSPTSKQLSDF